MTAFRLASVVVAILAVGPGRAQEPTAGPDYKHLEAMEWMIGDWEGAWEVEASSILASAFPPGSTVRSSNSYSWMQNKNYIGLNFRDEVDGKIVHEGFEMIGYDAKSKKTVHWLYSVLGGSGVGEWSVKDNTWKLNWSYTSGDGTQLDGVSILVPIDENTHTWQAKDIKENGKAVADTPLVTFRRAMTSTEEECREFVRLTSGRWAGEAVLAKDQPAIGKKAGDSVTSYTVRRPVADGRSFVTQIMEGETLATDLCAYDPGSQQIRVMSSRSSGDFFQGIIWKRSPEVWAFRVDLATADGQVNVLDGTITFSNNGNTMTFASPQGESALNRLDK